MFKFKIGIRNNLYYPLMLIVIILLQKLDEMFMKLILNYNNSNLILSLLIFISQFFAGGISLFNSNNYSEVELIKNNNEIIKSYNQIKRYLLIIFASYFNFIDSVIRNHIIDFQLKNRTKGFQIIFSAILCYFTIRIKIYKHQFFSLIIIFLIIIIILVFDFFFNENEFDLIKSYGFGIVSCFSRSFLDTIEKYLFEFEYLNPYKILMLEGMIGCLLFLILFSFDSTYEDFNYFKDNENLISLIFLLLLYFGLSYFKNIYRVLTIKYYSPMTRALAESIINPFYFIYVFIRIKQKRNNYLIKYYYIIIIIALFVISFFSLVYNDFIVLYCCGLEYNTHLEIHKRAYLNEDLITKDKDNKYEEEENNHENLELLPK